MIAGANLHRTVVGPGVRVRPLGAVHAQSFHYDANVRYMIGLDYLLAYEGGQVEPGDDMLGSLELTGICLGGSRYDTAGEGRPPIKGRNTKARSR